MVAIGVGMRESWINTIVSQLYAGGNLGSPKHDEARGSPTKTPARGPWQGDTWMRDGLLENLVDVFHSQSSYSLKIVARGHMPTGRLPILVVVQ